MKATDLQSREELHGQLVEVTREIRERAQANRVALAVDDTQSEELLQEQSRDELESAEPGISAVNQEDYNDSVNAPSVPGNSAFERTFNDVKRSMFSRLSTPTGFSGIFRITAQRALDLIEEIENISFELAAESAKLAAAAATGLLEPPTVADVLKLRNAASDAQSDIGRMSSEMKNAIARREAIRDRDAPPSERQNRVQTIGTADNRFISEGEGITENEVRDDAQLPLISGSTNSIPAAPALVSNQARTTSDRLQDSFIERAGYVVICAAISSLGRSKSLRDRARARVSSLIDVFNSLREMVGVGFLRSLQEDLQEQTSNLLDSLSDSLQGKLDAIDEFLAATVEAPGIFVSIVEAIGDVPDDVPLLQDFANICGIKLGSFCDMLGLMEIAKSLDADLSLELLRPPQIGRAILTVEDIQNDQIVPITPIPGIEALILLSPSALAGASTVKARFPQRDKLQVFDDSTGGLKEKADVFGSLGGRLLIESPGVDDSREELVYSSASFDQLAGVYTFQVNGTVARDHLPTLPSSPENVPLKGNDPRVATDPGETELVVRMDVNVAKDVDLGSPGNIIVGTRETTTFQGQCDVTITPDEATLLLSPGDPPLGDHLIGQEIIFGRNRPAATFTDGELLEVSGDQVLRSSSAVFDANHLGRLVLIGNRTREILAVIDSENVEYGGNLLPAATGVSFTPTRQVRRTVAAVTLPNIVEYSGGDLSTDSAFIAAATPSPASVLTDENKFRLTFSHAENLTYSSIDPLPANDPEGESFRVNLDSATAFPHDVIKIDRRQRTIRVFPNDQVNFLDAATNPQSADTRLSEGVLPPGSTLLRATFDDPNQELILGPVLIVAGSGEMSVRDSAFFDYNALSEEAGDVYAFTINAGTPDTFLSGDQVIVPTTSIFDQVVVQFPVGWEQPFDDWLRALDRQLTRWEATLCRLLGGRQENFGAIAAAIAFSTASVGLLLLTTRITVQSWLLGLPSDPAVERGIERLDDIGADRAVFSLKVGAVADFGAMSSGEATSEGVAISLTISVSSKAETDIQFATSKRVASILNTRNQSTVIASRVRSDISESQAAELEEEERGARALERLAEELE